MDRNSCATVGTTTLDTFVCVAQWRENREIPVWMRGKEADQRPTEVKHLGFQRAPVSYRNRERREGGWNVICHSGTYDDLSWRLGVFSSNVTLPSMDDTKMTPSFLASSGVNVPYTSTSSISPMRETGKARFVR
jgi:hypothetical protein